MNYLAEEFETLVTVNDVDIRIRPIRDDDLVMERAFVEHLSPSSRHFRFLGGVKYMSEERLRGLCDIDYDDRMAFVAVIEHEEDDEIIAIARYTRDTNGECESTVTVADDWQHHGLGRIMMDKLVEFARENNEPSLYSLDLADNIYMRKLARDLGMSRTGYADDRTLVIHRLQL